MNEIKFRPMRAKSAGNIKYPCIAQIKLDGVRALVKDGVVYSRSLKPIPNKHVQKLFGHLCGFDGELMLSRDPLARVFNETTSAVMTIEGEPDVYFHVFDSWERECGYVYWYNTLYTQECISQTQMSDKVMIHPYTAVHDGGMLNRVYEGAVAMELEGIIIRNATAPYKFGDSSKKVGELIKWKLKEDDEFKVVGFKELMVNTNEQETNELGRSKRSSKKEGKVPGSTLGALVLEYGDTTFDCGTGFSAEERKIYWQDRDIFLGKMAKVEYEGIAKNKPRFPSFKGFRSPEDILPKG